MTWDSPSFDDFRDQLRQRCHQQLRRRRSRLWMTRSGVVLGLALLSVASHACWLGYRDWGNSRSTTRAETTRGHAQRPALPELTQPQTGGSAAARSQSSQSSQSSPNTSRLVVETHNPSRWMTVERPCPLTPTGTNPARVIVPTQARPGLCTEPLSGTQRWQMRFDGSEAKSVRLASVGLVEIGSIEDDELVCLFGNDAVMLVTTSTGDRTLRFPNDEVERRYLQ